MTKKILSFILVTVLLATSCKKDQKDENQLSTELRLRGSWQETSSKVVRYNGFWAKVQEESKPLGTTDFDTNTFTAYYPGKAAMRGQFNISKDAYGEYLNLTIDKDSYVYKIDRITDKVLVLILEIRNDTYFVDGEKHTAAKTIQTIELAKR